MSKSKYQVAYDLDMKKKTQSGMSQIRLNPFLLLFINYFWLIIYFD